MKSLFTRCLLFLEQTSSVWFRQSGSSFCSTRVYGLRLERRRLVNVIRFAKIQTQQVSYQRISLRITDQSVMRGTVFLHSIAVFSLSPVELAGAPACSQIRQIIFLHDLPVWPRIFSNNIAGRYLFWLTRSVVQATIRMLGYFLSVMLTLKVVVCNTIRPRHRTLLV